MKKIYEKKQEAENSSFPVWMSFGKFSCTIKYSYKKKLSRKIFFAEENLQFFLNTIESFKFSCGTRQIYNDK